MMYLLKICEIEEDEVPNSNLGVLSSSSRMIPLSFSSYSLFCVYVRNLSYEVKEKFLLGFVSDYI